MVAFLRNLFDNNERDIQRYRKTVDQINALEPQYQPLTNAQLRAKTNEFRQTVQNGWQERVNALQNEEWDLLSDQERKDRTRKALDEVLDGILPHAFATVREAGRRTLGQRHYDVQLIGGMATHDGRIAELKTGEGKTLMATLPLYLNALAGRGAHLVTANDYLSKVGAVWMGPIYHLLGMTVGIIQGQSPETGDEGGSYIYDPDYEDPDPRYTWCRRVHRKEAYNCDLTYGTNNEFGFDYLRDNMAFDAADLVQRDLHFAIVDEVDSILIDEARTPLIISGFTGEDTSKYYVVDRAVKQLRAGKEPKNQQEKDDPNHDRNNPNIHYLVDEKQKTVSLTDPGVAAIERMLGINNVADDPEIMHYITAGMKAHALFKKDIDYVVKEGEIIIVDEFTGRLMFGRRYSDGLHQAIEAKEGVEIKHESQTLATITFQNLFRLYLKLAGMTGTAKTEEDEFRKIYGLDVVMVPTNRPMIRKDQPDVIYKSAEHKFRGIAAEILRLYAKQQPVLVGTRSIEMSEKVSSRITHKSLQVLAMVSLIRVRLEDPKLAGKSLDKAKKDQYTALLNTNLDELTLGKLAGAARDVGLNPDPLAEQNITEIASMLELPHDPEALDRIEEAMIHTLPHSILNAKYHEKEAIIIAEAGRKGAVTIATNMAGRGVDILLGGRPAEQDLPGESSPGAASSEADPRDSIAGPAPATITVAPASQRAADSPASTVPPGSQDGAATSVATHSSASLASPAESATALPSAGSATALASALSTASAPDSSESAAQAPPAVAHTDSDHDPAAQAPPAVAHTDSDHDPAAQTPTPVAHTDSDHDPAAQTPTPVAHTDSDHDPAAQTPSPTTQTSPKSEEDNSVAESELSFRRGGKHSVLDSVTTLTPDEHRAAADEVRTLGGLYILGSERHESRRIDNQLRGRAGRQGDPGESRFFVSLEDELWRLFGDRANHPLLKTWPEDQAMDAKILSRMIERAQKKVEEHHFESRKHVLQYDEIMNRQRILIYAERRRILEGANLRDTILGFLRQTVSDSVALFCPEHLSPAEWELDELYDGLCEYFPLPNYAQPQDLQGKSREELDEFLTDAIERAYDNKEREIEAVTGTTDVMRDIERRVALQAVNGKWMEHLANMDYLREGIGLRGYAQQDPLVVYNKEAFEMFENMQHEIQDEIAHFMFHVQLVTEEPEQSRRQYNSWTNLDDGGGTALPAGAAEARAAGGGRGGPARPSGKKPGRNEPCWCGSGKKYKVCHYPD